MHLNCLVYLRCQRLVDAKVKGLRLQGTLAKALPPMANAGSMTNVRQMEAEEYARDIGAAFEYIKTTAKKKSSNSSCKKSSDGKSR